MAGKLRPGRLVPWAVAVVTWIANAIVDFGPPHWLSTGADRFLNGAGIVLAVWALLAAYGGSMRERAGARRRDEMTGQLVTLLAEATRQQSAPSSAELRRAKLASLQAAR